MLFSHLLVTPTGNSRVLARYLASVCGCINPPFSHLFSRVPPRISAFLRPFFLNQTSE